MVEEIIIFILFLLGFVFLVYNVIILIKRKEYENKRIYSGHNVLIFGIIMLGLAIFVKAVRFGFLSFNKELIMDSLIYFDVISNLVLIPLFVVSLLVAMLMFREV